MNSASAEGVRWNDELEPVLIGEQKMLVVILIGAMLSYQRPEPCGEKTIIEADKRRHAARKIDRGRLIG